MGPVSIRDPSDPKRELYRNMSGSRRSIIPDSARSLPRMCTVVYGEVAEVTFLNDPYGTLRIEKTSNTGMNLPGAVITDRATLSRDRPLPLRHQVRRRCCFPMRFSLRRIPDSGEDCARRAGCWMIPSTPRPWLPVKPLHSIWSTRSCRALRIIKYDRKNMVAMPDVTFEVWRDGVFSGHLPHR